MPNLPVPSTPPPDRVSQIVAMLESLVSEVPPPSTHAVPDPTTDAMRLARAAAQQAGLISGSLALPPGPLGMVTVLPDVYLIWKVQRQLVSDVYALHDRTPELTSTHMLYCLFRHFASQVLRDVAVRAGQRVVLRQLTSGALRSVLSGVGASVSRRLVSKTAARWLPLAGAAAVGAYAYWDTLQVAKTAQTLLGETVVPIED